MTVNLIFRGEWESVKDGISALQKRLSFTAFFEEGSNAVSGREITVKRRQDCPEAEFALHYQWDGVSAEIIYNKKCGFFRALTLLLAAMRRDELVNRTETSNFTMDGIMLDCSRNGVPTVAAAKEMIELLSCMGLDMMMLYTEDTYEIPELPYFGYMRGRFSQAELREIDRYALSLGVELIPCIQTLAHLDQPLKWHWAEHLRDIKNILFIGEDATYDFLDKAIKSCAETFTTRRIHIGYDEAHLVGRGAYLDKNGYVSPTVLMKQHLDKVKAILEKYGLKPMMWGDMYLNMYEQDGTKEEGSMGVVFWNYYAHEKQTYASGIDKYRSFSRQVIFAGGVWTWAGVLPNLFQTLTSTRPALDVCVEKGVKEVIATMWGDNGQEVNWFAGLPGIQLYAEYRYCGHDTSSVTDALLADRLADCTGADFEAFQEMARVDMLKDEKLFMESFSCPSKTVLYQNIAMGLHDKELEDVDHYVDLTMHFTQIADKMKAYADSENPFAWLFDFPAKLAVMCARKWNMGIRLKNAYDTGNRAHLSALADELPILYKEVEAVRAAHRKQWFHSCRPFGWDVMDIRYGGVLCQIETAEYRLRSFLAGEVAELPELAEPRLEFMPLNDFGVPGIHHYAEIAAACDI